MMSLAGTHYQQYSAPSDEVALETLVYNPAHSVYVLIGINVIAIVTVIVKLTREARV